jgi:hypothetical protein
MRSSRFGYGGEERPDRWAPHVTDSKNVVRYVCLGCGPCLVVVTSVDPAGWAARKWASGEKKGKEGGMWAARWCMKYWAG